MGWAKYQEDVVSRQVNDQYAGRAASKPQSAPPATPQTRGESPKPEEKKMSKLKEFTTQTARPLPVILLADVSGSMGVEGKIDALNEAVAEMVATFAEEDDTRAEIHLSVIAFGGGGASIHKPLRPARETRWEPMSASGRTPMGEAFELARVMLEDRETVPSRAYRPTLVLVSDGVPTDNWRSPLASLLTSERASKATRFAMGIGTDADRETLTAFLANAEGRVFEAHEAREIKKFFRWVTMSVAARSRSATPNSVIMVEPTDLDAFEF
jgi:uncharacterized protein YegL